jgi:hypothetical protein
MSEKPDELSAVIDALHGDKKAVLKDQVKTIEEEIGERRLIAADTTLVVKDELHELRNESLNLTHSEEGLGDRDRKDRLAVEKERLDLSRELREEQRDAWKDVQNLRREEREVVKELSTSDKEHRRARELL